MSNRFLKEGKSNTSRTSIVRNTEVKTTRSEVVKESWNAGGSETTRSRASKASSKCPDPKQCVPTEVITSGREKLTKQLNFPVDDNLYQNLIPVNVNDSVLNISSARNRRAVHKKYLDKLKNKKKDPEPDLKDFLTEIEPLSEVLPKPDSPIESFDLSRLPKLKTNNFDKINEIFNQLHSF